MSLIRQIRLLLFFTLFLAFAGSYAVWVASSRGFLETHLRLKNADNAQALALSLSQRHGDATLMELLLSAQFDTGYYQRITLKDQTGRVVAEHMASPTAVARHVNEAPSWFTNWLTIDSQPGVAQVSDGWRALGSVEVVSHASFAHDQLWQSCVKTALWLLLLGAIACVLASLGVRRIRRPLDATVKQAQALMERRFLTVPEPSVPELGRLSRAMNAVVLRLKAQFEEQATQVDHLRQQAHCDELTGLSNRNHFMARLDAALANEEGAGEGTLYLIRVVDLTSMNRVIGYRQTDEVLQRISSVLTEVSAGLQGVAIGRLNGGDFGISMVPDSVPLPGPENHVDAIRRAFSELGVSAHVVVGCTRWSRGMSLAQVLAAADSALARAESRGSFAIEQFDLATPEQPSFGEDQWRRRLTAALIARQAELAQFPLLDRELALIHYECPMRLQLEPGGPMMVAAHWLPMAIRCQLVFQADELAVVMALREIDRDGLPRGVNLAVASLQDPAFVPRLRAHLTGLPQAARLLWLELTEGAAVERFELVQGLCDELRPLGVRIGLEHAGQALTQIDALFESGLDYVKLDASVVKGVSQDAAGAAYVAGTVAMLHGLGLKVYAQGVVDQADVQALLRAGVDGITGPGVTDPS